MPPYSQLRPQCRVDSECHLATFLGGEMQWGHSLAEGLGGVWLRPSYTYFSDCLKTLKYRLWYTLICDTSFEIFKNRQMTIFKMVVIKIYLNQPG